MLGFDFQQDCSLRVDCNDYKPIAIPLKLGLDDHHFPEVIEDDLKAGDNVIIAEGKPRSVISVLEQHL